MDLTARESLVLYYSKHNPTNLSKVDEVLDSYHGNNQQLSDDLEAKYGETLFAVSSAAMGRQVKPLPSTVFGSPPPVKYNAAAAALDLRSDFIVIDKSTGNWVEGSPEYKQSKHAGLSRRDVPIVVRAVDSSAAPLWDSVSPPNQSAAATHNRGNDLTVRDCLALYYTKHNPANLSNVDEVLDSYHGNHQQLSDDLLAKYGESLFAVSSAAMGRTGKASAAEPPAPKYIPPTTHSDLDASPQGAGSKPHPYVSMLNKSQSPPPRGIQNVPQAQPQAMGPSSLASEPRDAVGDVFVEASGRRYRCMVLDDFRKFRDAASPTTDGWKEHFADSRISVRSKAPPPSVGDANGGAAGSGLNIVLIRREMPNVAPRVLYDSLHDPEYRKTWDDNMLAGYNICQLNAHNDIGYYAVKFPWPLANRDFCNMRSWMEFTNGEYLIFNHSVLHAESPPNSTYTRAVSILSGYLISPMPGSDKGCILNFMTHTDPSGSIPHAVINFAMQKSAAGIMNRMEACAEKYVEYSSAHYAAGHMHKWTTPKMDWDSLDNYPQLPTPQAATAAAATSAHPIRVKELAQSRGISVEDVTDSYQQHGHATTRSPAIGDARQHQTSSSARLSQDNFGSGRGGRDSSGRSPTSPQAVGASTLRWAPNVQEVTGSPQAVSAAAFLRRSNLDDLHGHLFAAQRRNECADLLVDQDGADVADPQQGLGDGSRPGFIAGGYIPSSFSRSTSGRFVADTTSILYAKRDGAQPQRIVVDTANRIFHAATTAAAAVKPFVPQRQVAALLPASPKGGYTTTGRQALNIDQVDTYQEFASQQHKAEFMARMYPHRAAPYDATASALATPVCKTSNGGLYYSSSDTSARGMAQLPRNMDGANAAVLEAQRVERQKEMEWRARLMRASPMVQQAMLRQPEEFRAIDQQLQKRMQHSNGGGDGDATSDGVIDVICVKCGCICKQRDGQVFYHPPTSHH